MLHPVKVMRLGGTHSGNNCRKEGERGDRREGAMEMEMESVRWTVGWQEREEGWWVGRDRLESNGGKERWKKGGRQRSRKKKVLRSLTLSTVLNSYTSVVYAKLKWSLVMRNWNLEHSKSWSCVETPQSLVRLHFYTKQLQGSSGFCYNDTPLHIQCGEGGKTLTLTTLFQKGLMT